MIICAMLFILIHQIDAAIVTLNETEHAKMPPIIKMDQYETCINEPGSLYCDVKLTLVSDKPSQLLDLIHEYSAHSATHFNHSNLHYLVCVTKSCSKFYNNTTKDLRWTIEACLNNTLWDSHQLRARVSDEYSCNVHKKHLNIGIGDKIVAVVCVALVLINIVGSFWDFFSTAEVKNKAVRLLLCFSIPRNWKTFINSAEKETDLRRKQLQGIHGIKAISMCLVIVVHSMLPWYLLSENTRYIEEMYYNPAVQILLNGSVAMQTMLMISALLLVYYAERSAETQGISWSIVPKYILKRLWRLTPPYALVLGLTATWLRFASSGPRWQVAVGDEADDCRQHWWQHLLYINNYFDGSQCMGHSWYLPTDTQLYCLGVVLFAMCSSYRKKKTALSILFVLGIILPALHTYIQDLDAVLINKPETVATMLKNEPVFDHVCKRGHNNLSGYTIGLAMGYLIHHWQTSGFDAKRFQTSKGLRILYWSTFPLALYVTYSGSVFYGGGPRAPALVRTLYAGLVKPVFAVLIAALILGMILRVEGVYRGVLEWWWWRFPSRLAYSAYLWHVAYIRTSIALLTSTLHVSIIQMVEKSLMTLTVAFAAALVSWLLVEAPFANLTSLITAGSNKKSKAAKRE